MRGQRDAPACSWIQVIVQRLHAAAAVTSVSAFEADAQGGG
jgi:hypothetical protein